MADFNLKVGQTAPSIPFRLKTKPTLASPNGVTATLTGATVEFSMWLKADQVVKVNDAAMNIISATPPADENDPNVDYDWQAADVNTAGRYQYHVKVTYTDSTIQYFPDNEYGEIEIEASPT